MQDYTFIGYLQALWEYLLVSSPYLLLGFLVSGLVKAFFTNDFITKQLGGKGLGAIIKASLIGIPLPLCSCAVIPTSVTLRKSGASNESTAAFLISTPESGIDSIAMTYALMDLPMTIFRPLAAFVSAFVAGIGQLLFNKFELPPEPTQESSCCSKNKKSSDQNKFMSGLKFGFVDLVDDLAFWLSIGILAGAGISYFVPNDFFLNLGPHLSRLAILAVGIPLYICASATTPVAAGLIMKGMAPGAALILLLVGPATNLSNMAVLQKYIGKKGVLINIIAIVIVALGFSYLVDFFYAQTSLNIQLKIGEHGEHRGNWWQVACAVTLSLLVLKGVVKNEILPRLRGQS